MGRPARISTAVAVLLGIAAALDLVLKVLAVRRAVKLGDKGWVLPLALVSSVGVLPAAFLATHPDER